MKKPIPDRDARWIDEQGRPTPAFLEYVKDLDQRAFREKVSTTAPADTEVMIYDAATGLWTPGAN